MVRCSAFTDAEEGSDFFNLYFYFIYMDVLSSCVFV